MASVFRVDGRRLWLSSSRQMAALRRGLRLGVLAAALVGGWPAASWAEPAAPAAGGTEAAVRVVTLDEALRVSARQQPLVRQAQATSEAAAGRTDQARAPALPQVNMTVLYQRTTANFAPRPGQNVGLTAPSPSLTNTYNYFNFALTGSQLLFDFGQSHERWRASEAQADAYRAQERTTLTQVQTSVRKAYFSARGGKALVRVAEETLANQRKHLEQIQAFVASGVRPEIDLAQARTDVANARVQIISAQNAFEIAKAQLAQAMGLGAEIEIDVAEDDMPPVEDEDAPVDRLVRKAKAARPELAALERQRRAQELTARAIRGAYGPSLSAVASATAGGVAIDNLGPNWAVGAQLVWPIFQGGVTTAQAREADANVSVAQAQSEVTALQIGFEVRQAWLSVRAAKASIGAANEALLNARDRLRLAEGRYQTGVGSIIELGDAQLALSSAAAQVVQSELTLASARAQLLGAVGQQ
jgi:outer membrane protein